MSKAIQNLADCWNYLLITLGQVPNIICIFVYLLKTTNQIQNMQLEKHCMYSFRHLFLRLKDPRNGY